MKFAPYAFAPTPLLQAITYCLSELLTQIYHPLKFHREQFTLKDGGTVGLDWDGPIPSADWPLHKPLVVIVPGLGGATHCLYTTELIN